MAAYSWLGVKPRRCHKNRKELMPLQNRLIMLIPVMMLAFGIIAVAALYFAGGYILSQRDDLVAHGVQTSGTITGTDCTIRVSRKTRYGPSIDYEFLAGQLYQDRSTVASVEECMSMRPGSTIEITYLPDDPETSLPHGKAALDTGTERRFFLLICMAVFLIDAVGAYVVFRVLKAKWGQARDGKSSGPT